MHHLTGLMKHTSHTVSEEFLFSKLGDCEDTVEQNTNNALEECLSFVNYSRMTLDFLFHNMSVVMY